MENAIYKSSYIIPLWRISFEGVSICIKDSRSFFSWDTHELKKDLKEVDADIVGLPFLDCLHVCVLINSDKPHTLPRQ